MKIKRFIFYTIILIIIIALYIYIVPQGAGILLVTDKYEYKNDYFVEIVPYSYKGIPHDIEERTIKLGRKIELIDEDNHLIKEVNSKEAYDLIEINKQYYISYYIIKDKLFNFSDVYGVLFRMEENYVN